MPSDFPPYTSVLDLQGGQLGSSPSREGTQAQGGSYPDLGLIQLVLDQRGFVLSANAAGAGLSSWGGGPVRVLADLVHPAGRLIARELVRTAIRQGRSAARVQVRGMRAGVVCHLQLLLTSIDAERASSGSQLMGVGAVGVQGWDITSLVLRRRKQGAAAVPDPLTGAESRSAFADRLDDALVHRRGADRRTALVVAGVRQFVGDTETFAGDTVLSAVARRLTAALRPGDQLGRIGAGEFAVLCHCINGWSDLSAVLERLAAVDLEPVRSPTGDLHATVSISAFFTDELAKGSGTADALLARTVEWMSLESLMNGSTGTSVNDRRARERHHES